MLLLLLQLLTNREAESLAATRLAVLVKITGSLRRIFAEYFEPSEGLRNCSSGLL
jgi:hypothetical protein